jgi:glucans biosynthesis protein C
VSSAPVTPQSPEMATSLRRIDLDWLRVYVIFAVFVFHSGRFFDMDGWHVKNPVTHVASQVWTTFLANWLMPMIFVISGASLFYALGSRGARKFIDDKIKRLLVPFIAGVFTHVMIQVYLERISRHQFDGSFFDFIPHYFEGWYGFGGNFAWMGLHLWYLFILFLFSLLFYPLFRWLANDSGKRILRGIGDFLAFPGAIYMLALPIALALPLASMKFDPHSIVWGRNFGGWPLPFYSFFLIYGFIIVSNDDLQKSIKRFRWVSLVTAVLCWAALFLIWSKLGYMAHRTGRYPELFGILALSSWCWILTFLGFGFKHLTRNKPILSYASEAVLPFYILHQTVLLSVGYFVIEWKIPDLLKWAIIFVISFPLIMALYEFGVRRFNVMRFLFGMKPLPRSNRRAVGSRLLLTHVSVVFRPGS